MNLECAKTGNRLCKRLYVHLNENKPFGAEMKEEELRKKFETLTSMTRFPAIATEGIIGG